MKIKQFEQIERQVVPHVSPALTIRGQFCFLKPLAGTLRGFYFEPSGFNTTSFYVNMFFLPLCVPVESLHLTFGSRIGAKRRWDVGESGLYSKLATSMSERLPFLSQLSDTKRVVEALESLAYVGNMHWLEALSYVLVLDGEYERALSLIDKLLGTPDHQVDWELQIKRRVVLIRDKLLRDEQEACDQLHAWEAENISKLNLPVVAV